MIRLNFFILCASASLVAAQDKPTVPAPGQAEALVKPQVVKLDENRYLIGKVTLDKRTREIRIPARINMDKGLLEFLLVLDKGKVHESLLITDASPIHLNIAFMLLERVVERVGPGNRAQDLSIEPFSRSLHRPPAARGRGIRRSDGQRLSAGSGGEGSGIRFHGVRA